MSAANSTIDVEFAATLITAAPTLREAGRAECDGRDVTAEDAARAIHSLVYDHILGVTV